MDGKKLAGLLAAAAIALVPGLARTAPAAAAGSAPGAPGSNATWDESNVTGFADSLGAGSKVWYTLGNGELENAFYPQTDNPDTFGLQYVVTNGSSFASTETSGTSHTISLVDPQSLVWQQVNKANNGDFTITKTYIADPSRSVVLVQTTFDNLTSSPLSLYADYHPQLNNDGMGNTGGTDATSGDLVASNGSVSSALASSAGFSQTTTGYVGSASDGESALTSGYTLSSTYSSASAGGHIDQIAQIPVTAGGSTTFTLALAFGASQSAAISDASASLAAGFSSLESSFESGWHSWWGGLYAAPASVSASAGLTAQYNVSLMEVKADEDKTYAGAFVAAPNVPWGASVSADTGTGTSGAHGYHAVWTRDEYEMATTLLAAGDMADAQAALSYILERRGSVQRLGQAEQLAERHRRVRVAADGRGRGPDHPRLSARRYRRELPGLREATGGVSGGQRSRRRRRNGGRRPAADSPATMAAEIAGLLCAASIAQANGDTADAATYQSTAQSWAAKVDSLTYTTNGPYGSGSYYLRITPDGQPNAGTSIGIANGGGSHDDRTVVDPSFLELVRLGVKSPSAADITSSISVADSQIQVGTPEGPDLAPVQLRRLRRDGFGRRLHRQRRRQPVAGPVR